ATARAGYRIETFAGGGSVDPGDGRGATAATLDAPSGLARDAHGNVYIADHNHARVRRVARGSGKITTVAGTGERGSSGDSHPAAAAGLYQPTGLAFMRHGNLLIADAGNDAGGCTVRRVDRRGVIHSFAGIGPAAPGDAGDGGPATAALLHTPLRTAVS